MPTTINGTTGVSHLQYYQSPDQVFTLGGSLSLAHGLGVTPTSVFYFVKCITAELGYTPGQIVQFGYNSSCLTDASNLSIRINSTAPSVAHATTGVSTAITPANWSLVIRAIG